MKKEIFIPVLLFVTVWQLLCCNQHVSISYNKCHQLDSVYLGKTGTKIKDPLTTVDVIMKDIAELLHTDTLSKSGSNNEIRLFYQGAFGSNIFREYLENDIMHIRLTQCGYHEKGDSFFLLVATTNAITINDKSWMDDGLVNDLPQQCFTPDKQEDILDGPGIYIITAATNSTIKKALVYGNYFKDNDLSAGTKSVINFIQHLESKYHFHFTENPEELVQHADFHL
ncbi:MAG: hypothetical protein JST86_02645 [Bacteroidetes bacterium]|nr:hypothetical protein [Bacteroidota bacterium]